LREYVDVVRQVFRREAPVALDGEVLRLPYDGLGVGRPLKPILYMNPDLPVFLAAVVPDDYLDDGALIGDEQRIRTRWDSWSGTDATGLTVRPGSEREMRLLAAIAGCEPRPDNDLPGRAD
jgi:hypothetical protein